MNFTIIGIVFIFLFILSIILKLILDIVNIIHREKHKDFIPENLKDVIDKDKLIKIHNYSTDKLKFNLILYFFGKIVLLIIIFSSLIPFYYNILTSITKNIYINGLLIFLSFFIIEFLLQLPFDLYFNFNIEKKYGFNKMTFSLWLTDTIKTFIISIILYTLILLPLIFFIYTFKDIWFLLIWVFLLLFSLFMQIIYPTLIAPLFNKFEPLKNLELNQKIEDLVKKCGFTSKGIFQMDESKRTTHSNAYFIGLGKTKRIVLFDTLLQNYTDDEILAIISHELGHFKYKHILKNIIFSSLMSLIGLFLTKIFINLPLLYETFKINDVVPLIGLLYVWIISSQISIFLMPIKSYFSRKNKYQADKFAKEQIGTSLPFISALKKLTVENLSNIYPHPFYEWFYYSHPSILKRIEALEK
ncbi:MAG TPA: M48 family metallopeptidase [Spirochaetota bacterium]|nr:M48 family metallopeptidase [Spirochaetota bacterium]HOL56453.1 M48 family metallopeptidase [Spirochaetota bacterium]HPP03965.1 M48 family metallopeptidase [Spirochaetota bacterium]